MICPICQKENKKSRVYIEAKESTQMYTEKYFDENGMWHIHNPNTIMTTFRCTHGHYFLKKERSPQCASCHYMEHGHEKEIISNQDIVWDYIDAIRKSL